LDTHWSSLKINVARMFIDLLSVFNSNLHHRTHICNSFKKSKAHYRINCYLSILSVPDERSRNASCALNLISTFLFAEDSIFQMNFSSWHHAVLNFYFLTFLADNFKGDTEYNDKYIMHIQGNKHVQHYIEIIKKRRRTICRFTRRIGEIRFSFEWR
jgi:hypothetical protein